MTQGSWHCDCGQTKDFDSVFCNECSAEIAAIAATIPVGQERVRTSARPELSPWCHWCGFEKGPLQQTCGRCHERRNKILKEVFDRGK